MGPFKCPDCGIWWAGLEHRCRPAEVADGLVIRRIAVGSGTSNAATVRCTCHERTAYPPALDCPIHGINVTDTTGGMA